MEKSPIKRFLDELLDEMADVEFSDGSKELSSTPIMKSCRRQLGNFFRYKKFSSFFLDFDEDI